MGRFMMIIWGILAVVLCQAQPPAGYYATASGLTGQPLQKALHDIIGQHTVVSYSDLMICFRKSDMKADSSVWDMYSDKPGGTPPYIYYFGIGQECGNYNSEADCFNREHSFPKSWFNDQSPMYSDLHHIYPTDGWVNNKRGNYPFGETSSPSWTSLNGSKVGPSSFPGYSGIIFEPIDAYKGDFARTYFYMATRYFGEDGGWSGSDMTNGAQPKPWALSMLLSWHREDPVSAKEISRNEVVFSFQANRNPFIDNPLNAEKIWGNLNGTQPEILQAYTPDIYPNPVSDRLFINWKEGMKSEAEVSLFSPTGCLIWQKKSGPGISQFDLKEVRPGIYFLTMTWKGEVRTTTLIKAN